MKTEETEVEKLNLFDFTSAFTDLYRSRENSTFPFSYTKGPTATDATSQSIGQCHLGPNIRVSSNSAPKASAVAANAQSGKVYKSPLFFWMATLMVAPILIATIVISAVVLWRIFDQLPSLIAPVETEYYAVRELYRLTRTNILGKISV
jgi:hypothetical protein